jgi:pimeloyl-ACP methyl ester carboxylesterase
MRALRDPVADRYGTPGGPLVVLLHGAVANRKAWLPLARAISPAYELWCPDLPGHGARRGEPFSFRRALDDVERLVAAATGRRTIVAGDSLGGYLALALAANAPYGLAGVVAGGCTWSMSGLGGALARATDGPPALLARALGAKRMEAVFGALVSRATDRATAREIVAAGLRPEARGESLRELAGMNLSRIVARATVPIVFANGRYDWPTRAGERELLRVARTAGLVVSPRCGHGIGMFDPPAFARAIDAAARAARTFVD